MFFFRSVAKFVKIHHEKYIYTKISTEKPLKSMADSRGIDGLEFSPPPYNLEPQVNKQDYF